MAISAPTIALCSTSFILLRKLSPSVDVATVFNIKGVMSRPVIPCSLAWIKAIWMAASTCSPVGSTLGTPIRKPCDKFNSCAAKYANAMSLTSFIRSGVLIPEFGEKNAGNSSH